MTESSHEAAALHLAAIVESSEDAIISKDLDGIVTSWNGSAKRIFGYDAREMIGTSIRVIIPPDRQAEEDETIARIRRGERVEHYQTLRRRRDGRIIPVSLTVSPICDRRGIVVGASKIARDDTEREQAAAEREELLRMAHASSRLKDEFLATLSHELRTPLNAILGYVRMIRSGLVDGEKRERAMETIERNATSLTQIVEDILDVSRIIAGKIRLDIRPIQVANVVAGALASNAPAADAKNIALETELEHGRDQIHGDAERLQQVIWNLVANAVKFTDRGGRVRVRVSGDAAGVEVVVSDNGRGIDPEFLPHIFERFRQADASSTREHGGLGLGLAIARHLVEAHGGTIQASSPGRGLGATFHVQLPLRAPTSDDATARVLPHAIVHPAFPAPPPDLTGLVVLAVDDEADTVRLIRDIVETTGATVVSACSVDEAMAEMTRRVPDVLVADLGLPLVDGFELIARVRNSPDERLRNLPSVAVTAYARSEDRVRALSSGFQRHLTKPLAPRELMEAIAALGRRG